MSLYLTKILALFALPLGWAVLLGFAALLSLTLGRRRTAAGLVALQLVLLWLAAMPWTAYRMTLWLEASYPPVPVTQSPTADVALVLGGLIPVILLIRRADAGLENTR